MTVFKRYSMPVMLSALLMTGAVAVQAWPGDRGSGDGMKSGHAMMKHDGKRGHFAEFMAEKLDLSDDQKTQVDDVMASARDEGSPLREAWQNARQAERQALAEGADESTLRALAAETADARVDMMLHHQSVQQRLEAVLTDEQREQLAQMREERREKRQDKPRNRSGN